MRTPKYRIYIKHWGNSENDGLVYPKHGELHAYVGNWERFGYEEAIFQQYTGLLDKNGKEIYEGDILKCYGEFYDDCKFEYFQVFYNEEEGQYQYLMRGDNIENGGHPWCEVGHDWYVVGNIFENPELLT